MESTRGGGFGVPGQRTEVGGASPIMLTIPAEMAKCLLHAGLCSKQGLSAPCCTLTITGRHFYCSHFTDEQTEA